MLRLTVITAVAFTCAAIAGCGKEPLRTVRIAATTLPASAPVFIAEDRGYFEDEGLDARVQSLPSGRLALDALLLRKVDIATVAQTPLTRAVIAGKDPVIVSTISEMEGANSIVARKDHGIETALDLRGKRIGVLKGTTADYFLHLYLVTSGIDPKDVDVVSMDETNLVSSVIAGDLDGASAFAPYTFRLQEGLGENAVVLEEPHLYTTMWNAVVRREDLREDPEVARAFFRALARSNDYLAEHPKEAQQIVATRIGISENDVRREWASIEWKLKLDQSLVLALEDEARWMQPGTDTAPPNFLQHIDSRPLAAVDPSGVSLVPSEEQ